MRLTFHNRSILPKNDLGWMGTHLDLAVLLALLVMGGLKFGLVAAGVVPFNADEAVVALMARHILAGARPVFFYGQAYMGSLDAFLIAAGFWLFGQQVWVIRLVQGILYGGTLLTTIVLGRSAFGSWRSGVLAAWFLALPAVNVTLYTTASLGNYGEALLIGNLILLTTLRIARIRSSGDGIPGWNWLAWGFLCGLGLWVFGLTLVYSLPAAIYLAWSALRPGSHPGQADIVALARGAGLAVPGALLGAAPWWGYALANGLDNLLVELGGGAIAGVEGLNWWSATLRHAVTFLVLGSTAIFSLRPPWEVRWLALPLLPFAVAFWAFVLVHLIQRLRQPHPSRAAAGLLAGVMATLAAGFILTPFGADPSGRYFLPLAVPLALFAAQAVGWLEARLPRVGYGALILVLSFNLWGTLQAASRFPPGITTQFDAVTQIDHQAAGELIAFLNRHGERRGYTSYWVSYPLAFLSQETIVFTPRLPYHQDFRYTRRDDRYAPYDDLVSASNRVAYITSHHPALDSVLRSRLATLGVTWQEAWIGDYHVFYDLSSPVRPEMIGLGMTYP